MAVVTDAQVKELWKWLQREASLKKAAMKANMDRKTARKYRDSGQVPSQSRKARTWRTRLDPLTVVWEELEVELARAPGLQAKTLLEMVQQRYPGRYPNSLKRTLQRRVKQWRALHGPAKEVFFAQVHEPGRLGASDFTHMNRLGVTIQGQRFDHLVYHFVLTYSNWEHVTVCFSESFASLSVGLQNALWSLGGVPVRHRTDRMSLAVHQDGNAEEYTQNYRALLGHYGITAEATNPASGHENGDCEQSHRRFKESVEQALLVRGSRDFASREEYEGFLGTVQARRNAERGPRLVEELTCLRHLPERRMESLDRCRVKVSRGSTIRVKNNTYAVPSRLIGERVEARVDLETITVWYAEQLQATLPRLRGQDKHHVDYHHVIDWLERKPGAFARYVYQADLFPTSRFRQAYDELARTQSERVASREYVGILALAARQSESGVDGALAGLLREGRAVSVAAVRELLASVSPMSLMDLVQVPAVDLRRYDELLESVAEAAASSSDMAMSTPDSPAPWPGNPCDVCLASIHSQGREEVCDGTGNEGDLGGVPAGVASADDAPRVRGGSAASAAGVVELCRVPTRVDGAGSAAASAQSHCPALEGFAAAPGEELAQSGPEALADEGSAAIAQPVVGGFSGPARECAGVRHGGLGQDAQPVRAGSGVGPPGPTDLVHDDESSGAGSLEGQARSGTEDLAQATEPLGRLADRRPGLCAAEPGGDGSAVHAAGGALRTGQCAGDEQPGLLAVGTNLQGPDDDGGSDRPPGASLRDPGIERAELPCRGGQESQADRELRAAPGATTQGMFRDTAVGGPPWGSGSAALACAPVAVAARPLPSLRLAPLRQTPKAEGFANSPVGICNCR